MCIARPVGGHPAHRELHAHATRRAYRWQDSGSAKATSAARVCLSGLALSGSWEASCLARTLEPIDGGACGLGLYPGNCKAFACLTRPCFARHLEDQWHGDLALRELLPMSLEVVQYIVSFRGAFGLGPGSQGTTSPSHISCDLALSANGMGTSQGVAPRQQIWLVLWLPQLLRCV